MKCIKCNEELEADDNFCPTCGELTPHGYLSLKDNKLRYKENNPLAYIAKGLFSLYIFIDQLLKFINMLNLPSCKGTFCRFNGLAQIYYKLGDIDSR